MRSSQFWADALSDTEKSIDYQRFKGIFHRPLAHSDSLLTRINGLNNRIVMCTQHFMRFFLSKPRGF